MTALAIRPWPTPPDWGEGITETLEWSTEILGGITGAAQKREMRLAPRRSFRFNGKCAEGERRILDSFLASQGAAKFALPLWPHGQVLGAQVSSGATSIACAVEGREFGDMVVLWRSPLECAAYACTVGEGGITLPVGMDRAWPKGTRIYPAVEAQLFEPGRWNEWTDDSGLYEATAVVATPCDFTATPPTATYKGYPVLEWRPNTWTDPESAHERVLALEDGSTGPVVAFDFPAMPFRNVQHTWMLSGRTEQTAWREWLYWLRGRMAVFWVATWNADLVPFMAASSGATSIKVERCGYPAAYGPQRRELRIELKTGQVAYVRATGVTAGSTYDTVTLEAGLPFAVSAASVRTISLMVLSEGAKDSVQINHMTDADGLATCALQFRAARVPGGDGGV